MSKIYFLTRSLFVGIGLSYFLNLSGGNILIPFLLSSILGVITLYFKSNSIKEVYAIFICIFASSSLINLSHSLYLNDTPIFVLTLFTFTCTLIIGLSNKKTINKTAYYLFFPCIFLTLLEFILLLPSFSFENFTDAGNISIKNTLFSSMYLYIVSISPSYLVDDMDKTKLIKVYLFSMFFIFLSALFVIGSLGLGEAMLYRYPEYIVLKKVHYSSFFTNVENIFFFAILMDLIITISQCINTFRTTKKKIVITVLCLFITNIICLRASNLSLIYFYMHIVLFALLIINFFRKSS